MFYGTGAELLKEGDDFAADPSPQKPSAVVRGIVTVRYGVAREVCGDVRAAGAQHRPDAFTVAGRKNGEPANPGAARQAHDQRLCAVVGVMAGGNPLRSRPLGGLPQRLPASGPGASLKVAPRLDRDGRPPEGDVERPSETFRNVELLRGFGTQTVIHAMSEEAKAHAAPQSGQYVKEGHRIGPPAHGDEDGRAAPHEPVRPNGGANQRDERRRMGARHGRVSL
jgi:hypothetical protein